MCARVWLPSAVLGFSSAPATLLACEHTTHVRAYAHTCTYPLSRILTRTRILGGAPRLRPCRTPGRAAPHHTPARDLCLPQAPVGQGKPGRSHCAVSPWLLFLRYLKFGPKANRIFLRENVRSSKSSHTDTHTHTHTCRWLGTTLRSRRSARPSWTSCTVSSPRPYSGQNSTASVCCLRTLAHSLTLSHSRHTPSGARSNHLALTPRTPPLTQTHTHTHAHARSLHHIHTDTQGTPTHPPTQTNTHPHTHTSPQMVGDDTTEPQISPAQLDKLHSEQSSAVLGAKLHCLRLLSAHTRSLSNTLTLETHTLRRTLKPPRTDTTYTPTHANAHTHTCTRSFTPPHPHRHTRHAHPPTHTNKHSSPHTHLSTDGWGRHYGATDQPGPAGQATQ